MKRKLVWLVVLISIILGYGGASDHQEDYDYLKLVLQWPNSYCWINPQFCRKRVPQYFTLHGLWPEKITGDQPQYCPSSYSFSNLTVEQNEEKLLNLWPDLSTNDVRVTRMMWRHEWEKHGSCFDASMTPNQYFQIALDRLSDRNFSQIFANAGITANGKSYDASRILHAVSRRMGTIVDIVCEADTEGNVYLSQIHQCLDRNGLKFIDCDNLAKRCDADPSFPRPKVSRVRL